MVWMGIVTYGAVVVPILPDFPKADLLHLIEHSDSKFVFVGPEHEKYLEGALLPNVLGLYRIKSLEPLLGLLSNDPTKELNIDALFKQRYPNDFTREDVKFPEVSNEEVVLISYTSGTSGFSKGVMTTANNLAANKMCIRDRYNTYSSSLESSLVSNWMGWIRSCQFWAM